MIVFVPLRTSSHSYIKLKYLFLFTTYRLITKMATVHNPNNWHWMEKNCVPWAKDYFTENLVNVSVPHEGKTIAVASITSLTGDCDVTQRKGKVKCLFELKFEFVVEIKGEDDTLEKVTVILPEFEHDYDESDFNFQIKTTNTEHKSLIHKNLLPVVVDTVFLKFQPDLISTHERGLKHNTD